MSNFGLLPGSSFIQILIRRDICDEIPGGIVNLRPSMATWGEKTWAHNSLSTIDVIEKEIELL